MDMTFKEWKKTARSEALASAPSEMSVFFDVYDFYYSTPELANKYSDGPDSMLSYCWAEGPSGPIDSMLWDIADEKIKAPDWIVENLQLFYPIDDEMREDIDWEGFVEFYDVQRELRGLSAG